MAFCENCGTQLSDNSRFCGNCGFSNAPPHNPSGQSSHTYHAGSDTIRTDQENTMSWLAYLGITFWLPLLVVPNSKFAKYHANQGLVLLITMAVLGVGAGIVSWILRLVFPYPLTLLYGIGVFLRALLSLGIFVIWLLFFLKGLSNVNAGKEEPLPIIGHIKLI